jgi:heat shock protein HslJ
MGSPALAEPLQALPETWRALGNEPFWSLTRRGGQMTLETDFGATQAKFSIPPAKVVSAGTVAYSTSLDGSPLDFVVKDEVCVDTMSGMPRPQQVTINFGARRFVGCGGEPASLLSGHEWIVTKLAGQSTLAEPRITVSFAADARVSGGASCNRFGAEYQLTGEGLRIGNPMSSMMACEPPVMDQEQLFLGLLKNVSRFSIQTDGALVLHTNDERTIVMVKP